MKKIITMVTMMMVMVVLGGTTVKASSIEENRVKRESRGYECNIADGLSEDEVKARAIKYDVSYKEIASGIYDITIEFKVYRVHIYEYHHVYDAIEDYDLQEYGIYNGTRYSIDELADIVEERFPELIR